VPHFVQLALPRLGPGIGRRKRLPLPLITYFREFPALKTDVPRLQFASSWFTILLQFAGNKALHPALRTQSSPFDR
jgi:hypothetical protein